MERCAHLLLLFAFRAEGLELAGAPNKVRIPITQQHIADTLGLSLVHTNRTLGRLIRDRVIRWKEQEFEILNRNRLAELAGEVESAETVRPLL